MKVNYRRWSNTAYHAIFNALPGTKSMNFEWIINQIVKCLKKDPGWSSRSHEKCGAISIACFTSNANCFIIHNPFKWETHPVQDVFVFCLSIRTI